MKADPSVEWTASVPMPLRYIATLIPGIERAMCLGGLAWGLLLWWAGTVAAQPPLPRLFQEAVTIPVDNDAAKTLLTISDRWDLGRWQDALDDLLTLCETRGDSVVPLERGGDLGITRYVLVAAACEKWLAQLPPEGLERYRRRLDPAMELLWKEWSVTSDESLLREILRKGFYSRRGDEALWRLGQSAWTRGDLTAARYWWGQLLPAEYHRKMPAERHFPDPRYPVADVAARVVLCDLLLSPVRGERALALFTETFPDARGQLAGKSGLWVELLTAFRQQMTAGSHTTGHVDVPTFGGNPARNGAAAEAVDFGGELWNLPLANAPLLRTPAQSLFPPARPLASAPAVVDDVVYVNDGAGIHAVSLYSGKPVWNGLDSASTVIYPQFPAGEILPPRRPVQGAPLWTVTVGAGRLFANVGSVITTPSPLENREHTTELVCLDIQQEEGKLLWKLSSEEMSQRLPAEDPDAPGWMWEGTPLLLGTKLYAALSRRRPQLEWSLVCLDAESGQLLWHRPVGISRPTPPDGENLASHLLLAADAQRLYLATHWGALIAVDLQTGALDWAVAYRSELRGEGRARRDPLSAPPPCLVADDRVIMAPADSSNVMCLHAQTGELLWRTPVDESIAALSWAAPDRIVATGISAYGLEAATGEPVWQVAPDESELRGYGRGWMCGDQFVWPTREALLVIDPRQGTVLRDHPLLTPEQRREGGHVVVAGPITLVASTDRLTAYGQAAGIRQSREHLLSSATTQAARWRWQLGEIESVTKQDAQAREHWVAAVQIHDAADGLPGRWSQRAERRLVEQSLIAIDGNPKSIDERLALARQLAMSPPVQRDVARLALAWSKEPHAQIRAWTEWIPWSLRADPAGSPGEPTAWQAAQRLHGLRRTFGDSLFIRHDDQAEARWRSFGSLESAAALRLARREFPAATWERILARAPQRVPHSISPEASLPVAEAQVADLRQQYWQRRWSQTLPSGGRLQSVSGVPSARWEHFLIATSHLEARSLATGDPSWRYELLSPVSWAGLSGEMLYVVTEPELLGMEAATGRILWRRTRGARDSPLAGRDVSSFPVEMVDGHGLVCIAADRTVRTLDGLTGNERWSVPFPGGATPPFPAIIGNWLLLPASKPTGPTLISLVSGRSGSVRWPASRPWLRTPVVSDAGDVFVTVDDQRQISAWTTSGMELWQYAGAVSHAHRDPLPICHRDQWVILLEGTRLAFVGDRGRPTTQIAISAVPLPERDGSQLVVGDVFVAGHAGQLVAVRLSRPSILWRRTVPAGEVIELFSIAGSPETVGVVQRSARGVLVEIWDLERGNPIQSLGKTRPPDQPLAIDARNGHILLAEANLVTAWMPMPVRDPGRADARDNSP